MLSYLFQPIPTFAALCLTIDNGAPIAQTIPAKPGDQLHLNFIHSIYNSRVEEIFTIRTIGLQLTQLRYSEARLVDFYGYEEARYDPNQGTWIVTPKAMLLPVLNLRVSEDAQMSLSLMTAAKAREFQLTSGGTLRVAVAPCHQESNG